MGVIIMDRREVIGTGPRAASGFEINSLIKPLGSTTRSFVS